MLYRENGQYKTTYRADQAMLPIRQDRLFMILLLAAVFLVIPAIATPYWFTAILIPLVIMCLAALGVNVLVGYCGQISLGSGAFMAVGAYGCWSGRRRERGPSCSGDIRYDRPSVPRRRLPHRPQPARRCSHAGQ